LNFLVVFVLQIIVLLRFLFNFYLFICYFYENINYFLFSKKKKIIKAEYITFEEAYICIRNTKLPGSIREIYCEIIVTLFVDLIGNSKSYERTQLIFDWNFLDHSKGKSTISRFSQNDTKQFIFFPKLVLFSFHFFFLSFLFFSFLLVLLKKKTHQ